MLVTSYLQNHNKRLLKEQINNVLVVHNTQLNSNLCTLLVSSIK